MGALPAKWSAKLNRQPALLFIGQQLDEQGVGRFQAARVRGKTIESKSQLDLTDPAQLRRTLARLETLNDEPTERRILALSSENILRKRIQLPLAAEENLRQVLIFEMDRQTPFKATEVEFDWRIAKRDDVARILLVDLVVIPKPQLETALKPVREAGLDFDAVDLSQTRGSVSFDQMAGFNLLPEAAQGGARTDKLERVRWILAVAIVGLIGFIMQQSLAARENALEGLRAETDMRQQQAMETARLTKTVREAITGANFLADRKLKQPETIKVLLELTQIVPNDTWLERISFVGKAVQLQGQSASADQMIKILQAATFLQNPQFQGVIQPDPGTQLERFTIQADLKEEASVKAQPVPANPTSTPAAISTTVPTEALPPGNAP